MNLFLVLSFGLHAILLWCMQLHYYLLLVLHSSSTMAMLQNETDRLALLALKDGISEDPMQVFYSWNDSFHFCEWSGVTCSRRRPRVTALNLTGRGLVGYLSPHVANLTFLRTIDLSSNELEGVIPWEFGRLSRLRFFNLSFNSLGGEMPPELFNCSELSVIDLRRNGNIHGKIPVELGSLSKLFLLNLHRNNLTGSIPPFIGNMSSLAHLVVGINNLEGNIPEELGRLWGLRNLQMSLNRLSGVIPPSLFNFSSLLTFDVTGNLQLYGTVPTNLGLTLPNLRSLCMGANQFTGPLPASLSNATSLQRVDFSTNNFSEQVPKNLGSLSRLQWLNIAYNQITSAENDECLDFLTSLTNCSSLRILSLGANRLSGMLPNSIANLSTQLNHLWLTRNQISGRIPMGIENLINLEVLKLDDNDFVGPIPPGIGKMKNLQILGLSANKLSRQIPTSLGNATRLLELDLGGNDLEGTIPSSFGRFQRLNLLDLSGNNLSGPISREVLNLSSLSVYLDLSSNSFTGTLSSEVSNLKNLASLDVSKNKLWGEIPSMLGDCRSLVALNMESNFFQGAIPASLSNLGGLERLDLSHNNLSGQIPEYLGKFPSLKYLNLSFNNLEGRLPTAGIFGNASAFSVRGNKDLCGGFPVLQLPECLSQTSKKGGKSLLLKVMIPVSVLLSSLVLLSCSFASVYLIKRFRKKPPASSSFKGWHMKVSYAELLKTTNGFSVSNLIGAGSYGSVYKGILDNEMVVAVKVLNLQQQGGSKSFMAECRAMVNIRHRNLLKILTACSSIDFQGNDFKALVFEYMPNGSLEQWLHPGADGQHQLRSLNIIERLNIAIDVASALEYLHDHSHAPIVHRDLKPSNVLLDNDMVAHVTDFGLSQFLPGINSSSFRSQASSLAIKGSIGYVAPEYALGGMASTQGDVYSYGILLLEMFTGKRPTDGMFEDGFSIHPFVKTALPERVMEIADPQLAFSGDEASNNIEDNRATRGRIQECLVPMLQIGVACSVQSPKERMKMRDVLVEMQVIRDIFLGVGMHGEKRNRDRLLGEGPSYLSNY